MLDLYELKPGVDLLQYMQEGIARSHYILVMGTPTYGAQTKEQTNVAIEVGYIEAKRQQAGNENCVVPVLYCGDFDGAFQQDTVNVY